MTDNLKMPPHSIEAEQAVLGCCLAYPGTFDRIADRLQAEDFYRHDHQLIWSAMAQLGDRGRSMDALLVIEQLERGGNTEDAGGRGYVGQLAVDAPSGANVASYARVVVDNARRRQMIRASQMIAQQAWEAESAQQALDAAQGEIMRIGVDSHSGGWVRLGDAIPAFLEELEARRQSSGTTTGLSTGYADLDRRTTGLHPGQLIVVAGRPGSGKTAFGAGMLAGAAKAGKAAGIFSMEMSTGEIVERVIAGAANADLHRIRNGKLHEQEWSDVARATSMAKQWQVFVDDTPGLKPAQIRARARRLKQQCDLGVIVVDYVGLAQGEGENRTNQVSDVSRSLKNLAKELGIPVVALSQLNRGVEQRPNKRPMISDLRESGQIEQDADLIVFLYRDELYNQNSADQGIAEIIIAKQRNGKAPDRFPMIFVAESAQYRDAAPGTRLQAGNVTPLRKAGGFDDV